MTIQEYKENYGDNPVAIRKDGKWIFMGADEVDFEGQAFGTVADVTGENVEYLVNEKCEVIV